MKKMVALALAMVFCLACFFACTPSPTSTTKKETKPGKDNTTASGGGDSARWDDADFENETLVFSVSVNQSKDVTYPAADRYIKGPDVLDASADEVIRMVYNRNHNVVQKLNINLKYQTNDFSVSYTVAEIDKIMQGAAEDAPDIWNGDVYDLIKVMLNGHLWNVKNPGIDPATGEQAESWFDFSADCWYNDFMEGTTFDKEKIYMVAGDFFIDIVRMAWVLYVNVDRFDDTYNESWGSLFQLYNLVQEGEWDYDTLRFFCESAFRDTTGDGVADDKDEQIGMVLNSVAERLFTWTNGLSIVDFSESVPKINRDSRALSHFSSAFTTLYNTSGIYHIKASTGTASGIRMATQCFMNNTSLFCTAQLGELESEELRQAPFRKGLVPLPKFSLTEQEEYYTLVHDQAEVGVILNNTSVFPAASAYLQYINEQSTAVLEEYYENSLKFKYTDDKETRAMIDLVHDRVASPIDSLLVRLICSIYSDAKKEIYSYVLDDAQNQSASFASNYDSCVDAWQAGLQKMLDIQEGIE